MYLENLFSCVQNVRIWNHVGYDVILVFGGILLIWTLLSKIYMRKHGIVKPPGPVGLPIVGYLPFIGNEPHKTAMKLRKKYGDIIGLYIGKKYTVILNEYNVVKEVITHPLSLNRPHGFVSYIPEAGLAHVSGQKWQEQRRFCISAIRELGMGKGPWEEAIMEEVHIFVKALQNSGGHPTDVSDPLRTSVCSVVISLLIGRKLNTKQEARLSEEFSDVALIPSAPATFLPMLYNMFVYFRIARFDRAAQIIKDFSTFIREEIVRHKVADGFRDVHDFMNLYLKKIYETNQSGKDQHLFSENTLEGNVNLFFLGSTDTVFSSVEWLLRLMTKHRDIQSKVHAELIEVYGKNRSAKYEERDRIPYTFAVMMEAQRFTSIVPIGVIRRASQDIPIGGYTIPKDSEIIPNLWLLHHDPNYWDEPDVFRPERFLTEDKTKLIKFPPSYAPFSMGRRNCPGEIIGWMEILAYFTEIVKKFEVSTPPGVKPEFKEIPGLVTRLEPQALCFKERLY